MIWLKKYINSNNPTITMMDKVIKNSNAMNVSRVEESSLSRNTNSNFICAKL